MNTVSVLILFLLPFWLIRNVKYVLFWIYLWQLKQYHKGRFLDHFRTEKGKKLLLHPFQIFKSIILFFSILGILFFPRSYLLFLPLILFLIYFVETLLYFKALFAKRAKNPDFTKKTAFLFAVNILIAILFFVLLLIFIENIFWSAFSLLVFDILLPLIVSIIVIIFQPLADYYRLSLQKKAKEKIKSLNNNLTIIAITGSYGKTSTKEYLTTILSSKFKVLATREHQNTEVAIPRAILNDLKPEHEIFIAELGAYDKGTIKRICDFLQPEIGIVTGINEQHLALFGSMENLLSAEGGKELLTCLPKDGLLLVNGENEYCRDLYDSAKIKKIMYSFENVRNINIEKDFISFDISNVSFKVDAYGKHNILNLLATIFLAKELGIDLKEIAKASEKITTKHSSFKVIKNSDGLNIIDSTYSANPDGVIADLEYLKIYPGKKTIIMPCLIELGKASKEVHQRIGKEIAEVCDLVIITSKECFNTVKQGALKNGMKESSIELLGDANLVLGKIKSFCKPKDTILLEGRLSPEIIRLLTR